MPNLKSIWWRVRLAYHMRRSGMVKRRLRALPTIWEETGEPHWQMHYEAGDTPLDSIIGGADHA